MLGLLAGCMTAGQVGAGLSVLRTLRLILQLNREVLTLIANDPITRANLLYAPE